MNPPLIFNNLIVVFAYALRLIAKSLVRRFGASAPLGKA